MLAFIEDTPFLTTAFVIFEHPQNACPATLTTLSGMSIDRSPLAFENAELPIALSCLPKLMLVKLLHPLNVYELIVVTSSPIDTDLMLFSHELPS